MVSQSRYALARATFLQFKAGLEEQLELHEELLEAIALLLAERNTSFYENRFITGGAVEHMIAAVMRCAGLADVRTVGFENVRTDVMVGGQGFSVKSVFRRDGQIALINTLGGGYVEWTTPTIILLGSGYSRGIGYIDPELLPANVAVRRGDQIILPRTPLNQMYRQQPEYLLRCEVPINPGRPDADLSVPSALSAIVAKDIIMRPISGESLLDENFVEEFLQRTAANARLFPRLSQCMEEDHDHGG